MKSQLKIVYTGGVGEIEEKKSRFIATVRPVHSEEEALAFLEEMRKKYWNASHNCLTYVVGENQELQRASDDGEPSGTAGRPMLDVLLREDIHNAAVIVTRYFGGTLLGTGGLVRAYTAACQAGLAASVIITKEAGQHLFVKTDYSGLGKIQYLLGERQIPILNSIYTDTVELDLMIPEAQVSEVRTAIIEATSAQAVLTDGESCYFAKNGKELLLFPAE